MSTLVTERAAVHGVQGEAESKMHSGVSLPPRSTPPFLQEEPLPVQLASVWAQ